LEVFCNKYWDSQPLFGGDQHDKTYNQRINQQAAEMAQGVVNIQNLGILRPPLPQDWRSHPAVGLEVFCTKYWDSQPLFEGPA